MAQEQSEKKVVTEVDGGMLNVAIKVKDGEKIVDHAYQIPSFAHFAEFYASLPEASETGLSKRAVYDRFVYATDLKERASVREASAAESTVIRVGKQDVDLMTLEVKKAVGGVNAAFLLAATTGKEPQNAFKVARAKMLAEGIQGRKVVEKDGMLQLVKEG